jgi:hypothetical protein
MSKRIFLFLVLLLIPYTISPPKISAQGFYYCQWRADLSRCAYTWMGASCDPGYAPPLQINPTGPDVCDDGSTITTCGNKTWPCIPLPTVAPSTTPIPLPTCVAPRPATGCGTYYECIGYNQCCDDRVNCPPAPAAPAFPACYYDPQDPHIPPIKLTEPAASALCKSDCTTHFGAFTLGGCVYPQPGNCSTAACDMLFTPNPRGIIFCDSYGVPTTAVSQIVYTGLGCINTENKIFITQILTLLTGAGGGIALLIIIFAGFQMATAGGDPKKVQAAKELITSALVGLSFIALGVAILNAIGVNVLGLRDIGFRL